MSGDAPAACLPMRFDDEAVGVIAVYALLPQKRRFVAVDFELFKMLGAHAALWRDLSARIAASRGAKRAPCPTSRCLRAVV